MLCFAKEPAEQVLGEVWAFLDAQRHAVPPEIATRFASLPLVLCGSALVKPSRVFRSCFDAWRPLLQPLTAVTVSPPPAEDLLEAMGMGGEPTVHDYRVLLRELLGEFSRTRLTPSERRALVALLEVS